jgi:glycosyltransferase involved in cell wall biosynthesis
MGDMIVGVSKEICQAMTGCGIDERKTRVIHSGIDANLYSPRKSKESLFTIGAIGALTKQKGMHVLLDALKELRQKTNLPEWQCLIAGNGPLMNDLQSHANVLGISDAILFLGHAESTTVLEKIDVLAVPSVDGEGSNAVIKEGWATGTPLITSDLPSNLELVTDKQDGLVFPNRDAKALAEALSRLMTDDDLARSLVKAGHDSVDRFSVQVMGEQYVQLYKELAT